MLPSVGGVGTDVRNKRNQASVGHDDKTTL